MSDNTVSSALSSDARLVVVEAPAGCGKTYQGAECADHFAGQAQPGRVLVLTHTHAAANVFASRIRQGSGQVEIRTIHSLIIDVANTYHVSVGLPPDTATWARSNKDGYSEVAARVSRLVRSSSMVGRALAQRYPILICDEHQDASMHQEEVIRSILRGGARVRVLGDPMQGIYPDMSGSSAAQRWLTLTQEAERHVELTTPHRWLGGSEALGSWTLSARADLLDGQPLDLRDPPAEVTVIRADNNARGFGAFRPNRQDARPLWRLLDDASPLLVLTPYNRTVDSIRAYFRRRVPIWEGHTRENLDRLVGSVEESVGDPNLVCNALIEFMKGVSTGFSSSNFGNRLKKEVSEGCSRPVGGKKPPALQAVGRELIDEPNHVGVARALKRIEGDPVFGEVKIDYPREFRDAVRVGRFPDPNEGLAELTRRRSFARHQMPSRSISTVHKAKGLECERVLLLPCDRDHLSESEKNRRLLYVAISRATRSLTIVVPRDRPSALLRF